MKSEVKTPTGWELKRLNEICKIVSGYPAPKREAFSNEGVPFVRMKDLGKYHETTNLSETDDHIDQNKLNKKLIPLKKGSIIIPRSGSVHLNHRGILGQDSVIVSHLLGLICKEDVDNLFFYYKLCNYDMRKIMSQTTGLNMVSNSLLNNLKFSIPSSIKEQNKIASILYKVDEQIGINEKIISKTEELKKGLMQKLLTKGIGHTKFKKTELGEIPEEWEIKKIIDCCRINKNSISNATNENYRINYIDISSINYPGEVPNRQNILFKNAPSRARRRVFDNNILVSTVRPYLRSFTFIENAEENLICSTGFGVLEAKRENHPQFIYQYILSDMFLDQVNKKLIGSNYPAINNNDLKNIKIPLPSNLNEQKQIASILSKVDEQIRDNKKELRHLQELKKGLMQDLLTGKVRVSV